MNKESNKSIKRKSKYDLWDKRSGIDVKHNDRDIDSGLYYNEYENKWVSRVSRKVMKRGSDIKMYDFKAFSVEEIKKIYGKEKVERIGMFLSLIYERSFIEGYDEVDWLGVYFSSDDLKRLIGSDYNVIIKKLVNKGVLDYNSRYSKYRVYRNLKYFKLGEVFLNGLSDDFKKVEIKDERFEKSLKEYFKRSFEKRKGVLKKIEVTLDKCDLVVEDLDSMIDEVYRKRLEKDVVSSESEFIGDELKVEILNKLIDLDTFEKVYKRDLRSLYNAYMSIIQKSIIEEKRCLYRINRDDYGGRLYHMFSNIPKDFRSKIKIGGKDVVEIDIKASQPSFLCLLFEKGSRLKFTKGIFEKYNNEQYIKIAKEYGMDIYKYMAIKLKGKKFENDAIVRVNMKQIFFQLVFGKPRTRLGMYKKKEICDKLFGPEFYKFLSELASLDLEVGLSHKHKNLSYLLQKTECTFLNKLMEEMGDIPFLPIHDSLMVRITDAKKVKKLFQKVIIDNKMDGILSFS
jgi:hypothetical protein